MKYNFQVLIYVYRKLKLRRKKKQNSNNSSILITMLKVFLIKVSLECKGNPFIYRGRNLENRVFKRSTKTLCCRFLSFSTNLAQLVQQKSNRLSMLCQPLLDWSSNSLIERALGNSGPLIYISSWTGPDITVQILLNFEPIQT